MSTDKKEPAKEQNTEKVWALDIEYRAKIKTTAAITAASPEEAIKRLHEASSPDVEDLIVHSTEEMHIDPIDTDGNMDEPYTGPKVVN